MSAKMFFSLLLPVCQIVACAADAPAEMKAYTETIPGTEVAFDMLPIPGGTFTMGSPDGEADAKADEHPAHEVKIAPFWMGKFEVTWDEYDIYAFAKDIRQFKQADDKTTFTAADKLAHAVTRPTPPYDDASFGLGHDKQPALCITHHSAMEYCRWLSAKTGKVYRLATEAEWEYACRAGSKTAYSFGDDLSKLDEYGWFGGNAGEKPHTCGGKKPNAWGLYDMHGNVAEWVIDHYDDKVYANTKPGADRPFIPPDEKEYSYVARGGSWKDKPPALRSAARLASKLEWSKRDPQLPQSVWWHTDAQFVGFRIVRALDEQDNLKGLQSKVVVPDR